MEKYFKFVNKNVFEFDCETMKKEFQGLRSMINFVDLYENVKEGRDEYMRGILEENGIRCDMFKAVKAIIGIIRASISTEAYQCRFEDITDEWLDEFFNYLRSNPKKYGKIKYTTNGYLIPKSVSELILIYNEHKDEYKAEIEAFMSK